MWAKRDDCNSGLAYGGNKTRKLEFLAADALAQGCDTLVSIGGVQSNHTRQVAAVAAHLGLKCVLVQEHWVDWDDPVYERVGNILLSRIMGADVRLVGRGLRHRVPAELGGGARLRRAPRAGSRTRSPRAPPTIRSAASALRAGPTRSPSRSATSASSSTRRRLLGHRIDAGGHDRGLRRPGAAARRARDRRLRDGASRPATRWRASRARRRRRSGSGATSTTSEIVLLDEWHAGTYGIPDEKTIAAIRLCARLEGVLTDPVYEGKSMAALDRPRADGRIEPGSRVLYAHLGGQPALNAYAGAFDARARRACG